MAVIGPKVAYTITFRIIRNVFWNSCIILDRLGLLEHRFRGH